jgi:hypothetical protein
LRGSFIRWILNGTGEYIEGLGLWRFGEGFDLMGFRV